MREDCSKISILSVIVVPAGNSIPRQRRIHIGEEIGYELRHVDIDGMMKGNCSEISI